MFVFVPPQHKLEAALLALGQFQHALSELQAWLSHTHTTLDTQRPVSSDPKAIEIELAKHHVCFHFLQTDKIMWPILDVEPSHSGWLEVTCLERGCFYWRFWHVIFSNLQKLLLSWLYYLLHLTVKLQFSVINIFIPLLCPRFYVTMCCPTMPRWRLWTMLPLSCWSPLLVTRPATWEISWISSTRAGRVCCSKPRSDRNYWRLPYSRYCAEAWIKIPPQHYAVELF